jgi:hypothetical protein
VGVVCVRRMGDGIYMYLYIYISIVPGGRGVC